MSKKKFHKIKALLVLLIMSVPLQSFAKTFRIYFRDANADTKLSLYLWNESGPLIGDWNAASSHMFQTTQIGNKTWKFTEISFEDNSKSQSVNAIIRKHDADNKIIAQSVDIMGISEDTYLVTEGTLQTSWSKGKNVMLFHDITRSEAEGKTINYEVRMISGGQKRAFS